MDFHAVEARLLRSLGGSPVVLHDPWNLGRFQRPWDFVRLLAGGRVDVRLVDLDGRGSDGGLAVVEAAVGGPSHVPKLEEDHAALFMHGVGGVLPPFGHLVRVDARRLVPAVGLLGDRGRLGDEQARRTALGVVFGHQAVREASGPGPGAGHGGQDDPVRQGQVVQTEGLKEDAVGVPAPPHSDGLFSHRRFVYRGHVVLLLENENPIPLPTVALGPSPAAESVP